MKAAKTYLVLIPILFFYSCCTYPLKGSGPHEFDNIKNKPGIKYYVGKDVILVDASVSKKKSVRVNQKVELEQIEQLSSVVSINKKTVPDYDQVFLLEIDSGGSFEDKITISTNPDGLLTGLSTETHGKAGEIISNVGSIVGMLYGGITADALKSDTSQECVSNAKESGLDVEYQFLFGLNSDACNSFDQLIKQKEELNKLNDDIFALSSKIAGDPTTDVLKDLQSRLSIKSKARDSIKENLKDVELRIKNMFNNFKEKVLVTKETTQNHSFVFELDQIPPKRLFKELMKLDNLSSEALIEKINVELNEDKYSSMRELVDRSNTLFAIDPVSPSQLTYYDENPMNKLTDYSKSTNRIYYRRTYPFVITKFRFEHPITKENTPDFTKAKLSVDSSSLSSLIHDNSVFNFVEYKTSDFSKSKITLAFDADTNSLIEVTTDNKSSTLAVAQSISNAFKSYQSEYLSTLENIHTAQQRLSKIDLHEYQSEIDRLTKKKELLDTEIQYAGVRDTKDLVLEKKLIDQKLENMKSELEYAKLESTYGDALSISKVTSALDLLSKEIELAKKEASSSQEISLQKVTADLELLSKEIELAKKEITAANDIELAGVTSALRLLEERLKTVELLLKENQ